MNNIILPNPEIESVQPDIVTKLNCEDYFSDINIFRIREERIQSLIDSALAGHKPKAGKVGIAIEVLMPSLKTPKPNAPGPLCNLQSILRVKENPTLNLGPKGTGKTAEAVGVRIIQTLHGFGFPGICGALYPAPDDSLTENRDFWPMVAIDVKMLALFPLTPVPRPAAPVIDVPAFTVSLVHPDPAAVLYYTLDATFPGPGNSAAIIYKQPFNADPGTIIRAAALAGGSISEPAMSQITP